MAGSPNRPSRRDDGGDALGAYLTGIGGHRLLSAADEAELSERIKSGHAAAVQLAGTGGRLSPAEAARLRAAVVDGQAATQSFVLANLRLVVSVARRYQASPVPLVDLIQEGNIGLLRAVERFDHRKGFRFSTYATWWIRQAVSLAAANHGALGRLPGDAGEDVAQMQRTVPQLQHQLGRPPTDTEIASALAITPDRLRQLVQYTRTPLSLNDPAGTDTGLLADLVADSTAATPDDLAVDSVASGQVKRKLTILDPRERRVLTLRYGLDRGEARTLSDVGAQLGLSSERIRQLEARALCKLRHPSAGVDVLHGFLAG